jgi:DNA-binding response OmpR family regulator
LAGELSFKVLTYNENAIENNLIMIQPLQNSKALIVEDETDICYLLSNILKQKNIDSCFAESLAAIEKILESDQDFSVIFLDNHLPDGLGLKSIKNLKNRLPDSIIVMITAQDSNANRKKAEEDGIDFFLGKPFSKEDILRTVEALPN